MKDKLFEYAERMKLNPTFHEKLMAEKLDLAGIEYKTQWVIGKYIVDFIFQRKQLIIEIDGESHELNFDYDRERDNFLRSRGFKVVRIKNKDVKAYNVGYIKNVPIRKKKKRWKDLTEDQRTRAYLKRPTKLNGLAGKKANYQKYKAEKNLIASILKSQKEKRHVK